MLPFKNLTLLIISVFLTSPLFSQRFVASVLPNKVSANTTFQLTYTLEGADGNNFDAPSFKPFEVVAGPSVSNQMSIVNNKMSKKSSYTYTLMPSKEGKYTIPPATIYVGGKKIKSNTPQVTVTKSNAKLAQAGDDPYFVNIELSIEQGYVGQQIFVDYVLYTQKDIGSFDILNEPEYDGFYATKMNLRAGQNEVEIKGKKYITKIMKRVNLFAQQTGTYTFGPTTVQLGIKDPNQRKSNSFFFRPRLTPAQVVADAVTLQIMDIPPSGNPASSNAVGEYAMSASVDKRSLTTDDALTITMTVRGDGDGKFVVAPKFLSDDDFDIYDPNVTFDESKVQQNKYIHTKVFEYLAVPKRTGRLIVNPQFEYFDPENKEHKLLRAQPVQINVLKGEGNPNLDIVADKEPELQPIDLSTTFTNNSTGFYKSIPYFGSFLLSILAVLSAFFIYNKRKKEGQLDPKIILQQKAKKLALEKLSVANQYKTDGNWSKFYEEIIRAVKEYLSDKFQVPAQHLTKQNIKTSILSKGADAQLVGDLEELLNACEVNLYAPSSNTDMDHHFGQAQNIFEKLESITEK